MDKTRPDHQWQRTPFVVVRGRGAASGTAEYQDLGGSIRAQRPHFQQRGLDLSAFHCATINGDIRPSAADIHTPLITLRSIAWHPTLPPEDFSFASAAIEFGRERSPALIYYPRPETKGPYAQMPPDHIVELLAPHISGLDYGDKGFVWTDPRQVSIRQPRGRR